MDPSELYTADYFKRLDGGTSQSARVVVPLVLEMLRPRSVVDVGCGLGTWLTVFSELGVDDYLGIDGDYVDTGMLEIPVANFRAWDLREPLRLDRCFDLVVSLEVAEHLPAESAPAFVESLSLLGPAILFSAAIPLQGGTGHENEQWPDYWADLFGAHDFVVVDCLRPRVWKNEAVQWWYSQNLLVFIRRDRLDDYPSLARQHDSAALPALSVVHPRMYSLKLKTLQERLEMLEKSVAESGRSHD